MSLQTDINWIKSELDKVSDPSFVQVLKTLLNHQNQQKKEDWWEDLPVEVQRAIDQGLADVSNGQMHDYSEVRQGIRDRFNL